MTNKLKKLKFLTFLFCCCFISVKGQDFDPQKYIIEHENNIAKEQPAPHKGGGNSVGYNFFGDIKDFDINFRKRVLKPDAAIGYHQQKEDEVYYVVSGKGVMQLNDKSYDVKDGDAILTRTGSWHGIKNTSGNDLVLIIVYERKH